MSTFVLEFNDIDDRERFYASGILERHGVSEDDMESSRMSLINCAEHVQKMIIESAKEYNCTIYLTCGGRSMTDCEKHEKRCGAMCEFCQQMG